LKICVSLKIKQNSSTPTLYLTILHAYADNSGIYYNRQLRDAFIEDLELFDVDSGQYASCIV